MEVDCGAVEKVREGPERTRYTFSWEAEGNDLRDETFMGRNGEGEDDLSDADGWEASRDGAGPAKGDADDEYGDHGVPELR